MQGIYLNSVIYFGLTFASTLGDFNFAWDRAKNAGFSSFDRFVVLVLALSTYSSNHY